MSNQLTEQSRLHAGVSRRTALRGAAWTASAVTVVVAAPAYAAASDVTGDSGLIARRQGQTWSVTSGLTLARPTTVTAVMTVTINQPNDTFVSSVTLNSPNWSGSFTGPVTGTWTAAAGAGALSFDPSIIVNNNSYTSITISVTYSWPGGSKTVGGTFAK